MNAYNLVTSRIREVKRSLMLSFITHGTPRFRIKCTVTVTRNNILIARGNTPTVWSHISRDR